MNRIKFDKPHDPRRVHADVTNPLARDVPNVQKPRPGPQDDDLSEEVLTSEGWDPDEKPARALLGPGEGLAILFED